MQSNADRTLTALVLVWVAVPAHKNLHTTAVPTWAVPLLEAKLLFEWEPIKRALTDVIIGERKVEAYARDRQTGLGVGVGIARNTRIRHVRHPFEVALLLIAQPIKLGLVEIVVAEGKVVTYARNFLMCFAAEHQR